MISKLSWLPNFQTIVSNSVKMVLTVLGFKMVSAAPTHRFEYRPIAAFSVIVFKLFSLVKEKRQNILLFKKNDK